MSWKTFIEKLPYPLQSLIAEKIFGSRLKTLVLIGYVGNTKDYRRIIKYSCVFARREIFMKYYINPIHMIGAYAWAGGDIEIIEKIGPIPDNIKGIGDAMAGRMDKFDIKYVEYYFRYAFSRGRQDVLDELHKRGINIHISYWHIRGYYKTTLLRDEFYRKYEHDLVVFSKIFHRREPANEYEKKMWITLHEPLTDDYVPFCDKQLFRILIAFNKNYGIDYFKKYFPLEPWKYFSGACQTKNFKIAEHCWLSNGGYRASIKSYNSFLAHKYDKLPLYRYNALDWDYNDINQYDEYAQYITAILECDTAKTRKLLFQIKDLYVFSPYPYIEDVEMLQEFMKKGASMRAINFILITYQRIDLLNYLRDNGYYNNNIDYIKIIVSIYAKINPQYAKEFAATEYHKTIVAILRGDEFAINVPHVDYMTTAGMIGDKKAMNYLLTAKCNYISYIKGQIISARYSEINIKSMGRGDILLAMKFAGEAYPLIFEVCNVYKNYDECAQLARELDNEDLAIIIEKKSNF